MLGTRAASGQYTHGSDWGSTPLFTNPATWTRTIIDKENRPEGNTITFLLNPCEYVIYQDTEGRYQTCMPEPACDELDGMGDKLEEAMDWWEGLADPEDALDFVYGGVLPPLVGVGCPQEAENCPTADGWTDDGDWVVTRTYLVDDLGEDCTDAAGPALESLDGGACLRFFEDPGTDHTTRWTREGDIVFAARKWDNEHPSCPGETGYTQQQCIGAWQIALVHEIGHCLGFSHAWLTRHTLDELVDDLDGLGVDLLDGASSIMSYDRPGSIEVFGNQELNPYDKALYLYTYSDEEGADPNDDFFAAHGTVVTDNEGDCTPLTDPELVFGAGVIALAESSPNTFTPVQMSITGLDPLGDGAFRLEHLERAGSYRILVADIRDPNQVTPNGWDFEDMEDNIPGVAVFRTDLWSEANSGPAYQYAIPARFETGFDFALEAEFGGPGSGDAGPFEICVEFP